ncbi:hypothetical protein GWG54_17770 [Natronococcus sp. JC468]|uniref:hypothetical protein n=1 Tax=Natronococcus sp. JC468 TaxID=1961921 RepID=UPI00143C5335|nr:hypothetical protein [Natronococcus sp. JC468]NKE37618.1 hypothetical protein [Natronococcus sp. JC468]
MPSATVHPEFPTAVSAALVVGLLVILAYALLTGQVFLWLFVAGTVGISAFVLFLFYRLVVAVEEIAYEP